MRKPSIDRTCIAGIGVMLLAGCDHPAGTASPASTSQPTSVAAPAATENLPLVPHPEYVHWSRFAVGAGVIRQKEVTNDSGTVRVTTTLRLVEKTAEEVVVASQVTVDRGEGSLVENPPLPMEFPATFPLPAGMKLEQFALPSQKAKLQGTESRLALGREFQTELFTWNEVNEAGPMAVKLWRSDEIPGRTLRQEINGHNHQSMEEVVEIIGKE